MRLRVRQLRVLGETQTLRWTSWLWLILILIALGTHPTSAQRSRREAPVRTDEQVLLAMTPAVACLSIDQAGQYEPLPDAALTSEEKLLVFYRPLNYHVERKGSTYHLHLVQDGRVRPRESQRVLFNKRKMIDDEWKGTQAPGNRYMRSQVSLKGLAPGDYEFEITLHDLLAPGEPTCRQTLPFKIIPPGPRSQNGPR
jgi:hypothetical protein